MIFTDVLTALNDLDSSLLLAVNGWHSEWADAFIAVRLDGESIREYAARIGADENNITQKLKRAEKKLRENYIDRQI